MPRVESPLEIENARIMFRNFKGVARQFNEEGKRNFCVAIDDLELADQLKNDGWNIKYLRPREEGDEPQPYLQCEVSYKVRPPKILVITQNGRTPLDEESVGMLDYADIQSMDLVISPYNWEMNGRSGVKAYLKSMYVTLDEDRFAGKYESRPTQEELPWD